MADKKISQLTAATTPLVGTEVLPIVQSGTTKKVTALELTGTTIDFSGNVTIPEGNLVQGTAAKGINFTANTGAAGMTSQLLNWYEEGTWTPILATEFGTNFTSVSYTNQIGRYTRLGRMVFVQCRLTTSSVTIGSASGVVVINGLPFNAASGQNSAGNISAAYNWGSNSPITALVSGGSVYLIKQLSLGGNQDNLVPADVNIGASGNDVYFSACYTV